MHLVLRRANAPRISGQWQDEDNGVFDRERQTRFWSVSFQLTGRKSYGLARHGQGGVPGGVLRRGKVVPADLFTRHLLCHDGLAGCRTARRLPL